MKKYNVTFVLSTSLTAGGGTEQFVLNVVKNARPDMFNISIVQTDMQDASRLDPQYVNNVLKATTVYTIRSFRRHLRPFENASNYATLALKLFLTYLFSVIYRAMNSSVLARIRDSDLVYLIRNDDLPYLRIDKRRTVVLGSTHCSTLALGTRARGLRTFRRQFRILKYRKIDGFHFTSVKWWRQAVIHKKYDFVLPLGVDTGLYYPRVETRSGRTRFLFVSRLEADKGVTRLLEAWRIMKDDDAELHIVGAGSLVDLVKARADGKWIIYHGVLSEQDLATLYRSCDVFVFPTQDEIYGLVALQALASGLFAIVSEDLRGNFDEFEKMGMLEYVPNNARTISAVMTRIASELELWQSSRRRVYEYIRTNQNWRVLSPTLFSAFERVLQRGGAR